MSETQAARKNTFRKIPVTITLMVLNLVIFLVVDFTGGTSDTGHMVFVGAVYPPYVLERGEWYRLFTSMFLHFGIEHLINNMVVLYVLGERLERITGHVVFALIYLVGGLGGGLVSLARSQSTGAVSVSAGASGCVFALMGGILYVILRNRGRAADLTLRRVLVMAGVSLYLGFASRGVDNAAHIGGMVTGFLVAVLLYHPRRQRRRQEDGATR